MKNKTVRLAATIVTSILLILLLVSACSGDLLGSLGNDQAGISPPAASSILAPANQSRVVVNSAVNFLSAHAGDGVSRVELYVDNVLQRSDFPENGRVLQPWVPTETKTYDIKIRSLDANNQVVSELTSSLMAISDAVAAPGQAAVPQATDPAPAPAPPPQPRSVPPQDVPVIDSQSTGGGSALALCQFNGPNAPQLRTFSISAEGDITIDVQATSRTALDESQQSKLVVEWLVENADHVTVTVLDNNGEYVLPSPVNEMAARVFFPVAPGQYTVTIAATNTACPPANPASQTNIVTVIPKAQPTAVIVAPTPIPTPSPTPTPYFLPPPPYPGVPPGPTQAQLPELRPPVCDAADYVGVYVPPGNTRIFINEPDEIAARTVGGTLVHRAWRLQNTGTCTWGPGYELAFYGGRSMGSGGVAFESFFPTEPERRNTVISGDSLIAPEGKPNQISVLELALNAPVTPGIHQSYWRMRNPQGVYFGPIVGVTMEVVRDCNFGIYGAPVVNYFEIGRVGDVFDPYNPVDVIAQRYADVEFNWSISNAQDYDIIVTSPTGKIDNIKTTDTTDRRTVAFNEIGVHDVTLYADNGSCTAIANTTVKVVPNDQDYNSFLLEINRASNSSDALDVRWRHQDNEITEVVLYAQRYERSKGTQCLGGFDFSSSSWTSWMCEDNQWSDWVPVPGAPLPTEIVGVGGEAVPAGVASSTPNLDGQDVAIVGGDQVAQGSSVSVASTIGATAQGSAIVQNVEWGLCPAGYSPNDPNQTKDIGIRYQLRSKIGNNNAVPSWSKTVDIRCGAATSGRSSSSGSASSAGTENQPSPEFNPD